MRRILYLGIQKKITVLIYRTVTEKITELLFWRVENGKERPEINDVGGADRVCEGTWRKAVPCETAVPVDA